MVSKNVAKHSSAARCTTAVPSIRFDKRDREHQIFEVEFVSRLFL